MTEIEELAAEANAVRETFLRFWGAHSSADISRVGTDPTYPETPQMDKWFPRDGSPGKFVEHQGVQR